MWRTSSHFAVEHHQHPILCLRLYLRRGSGRRVERHGRGAVRASWSRHEYGFRGCHGSESHNVRAPDVIQSRAAAFTRARHAIRADSRAPGTVHAPYFCVTTSSPAARGPR